MANVIECSACGKRTLPEARYGFTEPDLHCECGYRLTNDARVVQMAGDRLDLEEASPIAARHTYKEIMAIAHRGHQDPGCLSPTEMDALAAFVLLRNAGLPSHADEKGMN